MLSVDQPSADWCVTKLNADHGYKFRTLKVDLNLDLAKSSFARNPLAKSDKYYFSVFFSWYSLSANKNKVFLVLSFYSGFMKKIDYGQTILLRDCYESDRGARHRRSINNKVRTELGEIFSLYTSL